MSQPIVLKVVKINKDSPNLNTYVFEHNIRAKSGQFVMVWMPGVDEVPMSIGWQTDTEFHVGIADAGDCTKEIVEKIKVGDKLGIRGPYGTQWDYKDYDQVICVGGGYGTPPLLNLSQKTTALGIKTTMLEGARNKDFILYAKQFKSLGVDFKVSTDDGSEGHEGYCTDLLEEELKKADLKKKICVYSCGPEAMMVKVAKLAEQYKVDCQVSLERYMKCGFGICGQCCMDDSGIRICKDGPVISGKTALEHVEFGKYARGQSGLIENCPAPRGK